MLIVNVIFLRPSRLSTEKLAEEPSQTAKKPAINSNINKWDGEDEDDVKVSLLLLRRACVELFHLCVRVCLCVCDRVRCTGVG